MDKETYLKRQSSSKLLSTFHSDPHYRKLQRVQYNLEDERRKLDKKLELHERRLTLEKRKLIQQLEHHERELREAKRRLEEMLQTTNNLRGSTYSSSSSNSDR